MGIAGAIQEFIPWHVQAPRPRGRTMKWSQARAWYFGSRVGRSQMIAVEERGLPPELPL